jgi:cytochrome c oxidase assembly protein subunit 15
MVLFFHLFVAVALLGHILALAWSTWRRAGDTPWLTRPATALAALVVAQLSLGFATLIVKYGWPAWLGGEVLASDFTVTAQGFWSSMIVTAHVANGSLILATLAVLWARLLRTYGWGFSAHASRSLLGVTA